MWMSHLFLNPSSPPGHRRCKGRQKQRNSLGLGHLTLGSWLNLLSSPVYIALPSHQRSLLCALPVLSSCLHPVSGIHPPTLRPLHDPQSHLPKPEAPLP